MKQMIKLCLRPLVFGFIVAVTGSGVASAESTLAKEIGDTTMALHHLHSLMNHALRMVLQGGNLVILSEMAKAPGADITPEEHVRAMFDNGKILLQRAMMDEEMKAIHARGADAKLMRYTHALGEAMQKVVASLDKISMPRPEKKGVALQHLRMDLNQALMMATEGSNIIMSGREGMTPKVDKAFIEHGQAMLTEARKLWQVNTEEKGMQDLMRPGQSAESAATMTGIHELVEAGTKVLDLETEMYLHQQ
jgi:hypothetical protein